MFIEAEQKWIENIKIKSNFYEKKNCAGSALSVAIANSGLQNLLFLQTWINSHATTDISSPEDREYIIMTTTNRNDQTFV